MSNTANSDNHSARISYVGRGGARKKARLRLALHRAFVRWLDSEQRRFLVLIRTIKVRHHYIELGIPGFGGCLVGRVHSWGMSVSANWQGECLDLLWDDDVAIARSQAGYFCKLCLPEALQHYPTREALWNVHTFEPFLQFVNEHIAKAEYLSLYRIADAGMTWAQLNDKPDASEDCIASVSRDGAVRVDR